MLEAQTGKLVKLSVFTFAIMNVVAIVRRR